MGDVLFLKRSLVLPYGVATLAVALVVLLKLILDPLITEQSPFLLLAGAVVVGAWFGGLGPGLLATALGALAADYFFLPPRGSFTGLGLQILPLVLFAAQGLVISWLTEALHSARQHAQESALEVQRHQEELRQSEERFRALVQNSSDIITVIDAEGTIRYVSPAVERVTGYRPEELVGNSVFDYVRPDDLKEAQNLFAEAGSRPGVHPPFEFRVPHKDGSWRHAEFLLNNLLDDPSVRGIVVNQRDITERKGAEEELRQSEERYRVVVEKAAENIFLVDAETRRVLEANAALQRSLGYSPEELKQMTLYDIVAHDRRSIERNVERILAGELFSGERRYRRKDGSLVDVEVNASVISYGGKDTLCVVAHDVTERKRAEQKLRDTLDRLLALYEAGQVLGSSLKRGEIGSRLLETVERISDLSAAVVDLRDERGQWRLLRTTGPEDLWRWARSTPEVLAARRAALESEGYRAFELQLGGADGARLKGLCQPLRVRERIIGMLEAYGPLALVERGTVETLASLANQAASALENARLYGELAEHERELQELVGKLVTAQEEERRRVAYEVHDGLAQTAAAAYQHLQNTIADHPPGTTGAQAGLDQALELIRQTVEEARRVVANLRPTVLDDFGLATALRLQVEGSVTRVLRSASRNRWKESACRQRWRRRSLGSHRNR
jgi:PAS domain S-box-containing protein